MKSKKESINRFLKNVNKHKSWAIINKNTKEVVEYYRTKNLAKLDLFRVSKVYLLSVDELEIVPVNENRGIISKQRI